MACHPKLAHPEGSGERRMERETGIEPATNSLEGCDSTIELLPPSRRPAAPSPALRRASPRTPCRSPPYSGKPRVSVRLLTTTIRRGRQVSARTAGVDPPARTCSPGWLAIRSSRSERRMVAREGFEPSKALGRQIYSLLRLTASLPRRSSRGSATEHAPPHSTRPIDLSGNLRRFANFSLLDSWSWRRDLNPRPADYKSAALPD